MRILTVEPGPEFSVADVHNGYRKAFQQLGHQVRNFNLGDRITFAENALPPMPAKEKTATAARMVAEQLRAACFDFWPDLVVITSAFLIPPETFDIIRDRRIKIAVILTESPYEDPTQIGIAARSDLAVINDPINLNEYRKHQPNTHYIGHAYDPELHKPQIINPNYQADFGFVGTGFPSRVEFLEQINFDQLTVKLAGNWQQLDATSPLAKHLLHHESGSFPNSETVRFYSSIKVSANLYRKEGADGHLTGYACGPREIELAAVGTFFLRESRPESDELFPMLPTYESPQHFSELLHKWVTDDRQRQQAARLAQLAVKPRTFTNNALLLLERLDTN
jgi:hypothetical protein